MRSAAFALAAAVVLLGGCVPPVADVPAQPVAAAHELQDARPAPQADRSVERPADVPHAAARAAPQESSTAAAPATRTVRAQPEKPAEAPPQDPFTIVPSANASPSAEAGARSADRPPDAQLAADRPEDGQPAVSAAEASVSDDIGPMAAPPEPSRLWMWLFAAGVTVTVASLGLLALQPSWKRGRWWRLLKAYLRDWSTGGYDETPSAGIPVEAAVEDRRLGPVRVVPAPGSEQEAKTTRRGRRSSTHVTLPIIQIFKNRKKG